MIKFFGYNFTTILNYNNFEANDKPDSVLTFLAKGSHLSGPTITDRL